MNGVLQLLAEILQTVVYIRFLAIHILINLQIYNRYTLPTKDD